MKKRHMFFVVVAVVVVVVVVARASDTPTKNPSGGASPTYPAFVSCEGPGAPRVMGQSCHYKMVGRYLVDDERRFCYPGRP